MCLSNGSNFLSAKSNELLNSKIVINSFGPIVVVLKKSVSIL